MDYELLLLIAFTVGLTVRALWASAILGRHIGWLVALSWTVGLISLESEWLAIPCLLVFLISEFIYQTGGRGPSTAPPARWLTPLRRHLPPAPPGRHARTTPDAAAKPSHPPTSTADDA